MAFQPTGESTTVPAPIGGLNTRDAPDMMEQSDAIRLDNFFSRKYRCVAKKWLYKPCNRFT